MAEKTVEKILRYNAVFEQTADGRFTVTVPRLPGLIVEAANFEDAQQITKQTIEDHLAKLQKEGKKIPSPFEKSFTAPIDIRFPLLHRQNIKVGVILLIIFIIGAALGGGFYAYQKGYFNPPDVSIPSPTPSPEAKSTPDPTIDWPRYTNDYMGITFKYPDTLTVLDQNHNEVTFVFADASEPVSKLRPLVFRNSYSIEFEKIPSCKPPDNITKFPCMVSAPGDNPAEPSVRTLKISDLAAEEAYILKTSSSGAKIRYIHLQNPKLEIVIEVEDSLKEEIDQILSTFKFTS